jgi:hypothetical protein
MYVLVPPLVRLLALEYILSLTSQSQLFQLNCCDQYIYTKKPTDHNFLVALKKMQAPLVLSALCNLLTEKGDILERCPMVMAYEGLGEMSESDSPDMCAETFRWC